MMGFSKKEIREEKERILKKGGRGREERGRK